MNTIEIIVLILGVVLVGAIAGVITFCCCYRRSTGKRYAKVGSRIPEESSLIRNNTPTMYYPPTVSTSNSSASQQPTMVVNGSSRKYDELEHQEKERVKRLMHDQMLAKEDETLAATVLITPSNTVDTNADQIRKQQSNITDATLKIDA